MTTLRVLLALLFVVAVLPAVSGAAELVDLTEALDASSADFAGSPNMTHVANVAWDDTLRAGDGRTIDTLGGTDVEFATIDGVDYAVVGTYRNGLQMVDVSDPATPELVATYDCRVLQGDVQTFAREEVVDGQTVTKTYASYAIEGGGSNAHPSQCFADAGVSPQSGTLFIDISDPTAPKAVSLLVIVGGSHNQTVHPSGDYLYNSNSSGAVCSGCIEVYDISDLHAIAEVKLMETGHSAHDITFNAAGDRAYAASIDHSAIFDTSDPADPQPISEIDDPAVTLHHQADPVAIGHREFLIINDELNGAGGNEVCPGGGLHVWEITGNMEDAPEKVGAYFAPDITVREGAGTGMLGTVTCTSHVFRIYPEQQKLVIGWFGAGVRVIDLSGLADLPVAGSAGVAGQSIGTGMVEIAYHRFQDSDSWAAKVMSWEDDGSAHIYSSDQTRGLDVYYFDNTAETAAGGGTWVSPVGAQLRHDRLLASGFAPSGLLICDLTFGRA